LPIHFHKQTVGVIGITGNPDEIRHCAELVQMAAELVLEQSFLLEQVQWKQQLQNDVVNQLVHEQNVNVVLVKERASILGIELNQPRAVIILKNPEEEKDPSSLRHQLDYILDQAFLFKIFMVRFTICCASSFVRNDMEQPPFVYFLL